MSSPNRSDFARDRGGKSVALLHGGGDALIRQIEVGLECGRSLVACPFGGSPIIRRHVRNELGHLRQKERLGSRYSTF